MAAQFSGDLAPGLARAAGVPEANGAPNPAETTAPTSATEHLMDPATVAARQQEASALSTASKKETAQSVLRRLASLLGRGKTEAPAAAPTTTSAAEAKRPTSFDLPGERPPADASKAEWDAHMQDVRAWSDGMWGKGDPANSTAAIETPVDYMRMGISLGEPGAAPINEPVPTMPEVTTPSQPKATEQFAQPQTTITSEASTPISPIEMPAPKPGSIEAQLAQVSNETAQTNTNPPKESIVDSMQTAQADARLAGAKERAGDQISQAPETPTEQATAPTEATHPISEPQGPESVEDALARVSREMQQRAANGEQFGPAANSPSVVDAMNTAQADARLAARETKTEPPSSTESTPIVTSRPPVENVLAQVDQAQAETKAVVEANAKRTPTDTDTLLRNQTQLENTLQIPTNPTEGRPTAQDTVDQAQNEQQAVRLDRRAVRNRGDEYKYQGLRGRIQALKNLRTDLPSMAYDRLPGVLQSKIQRPETPRTINDRTVIRERRDFDHGANLARQRDLRERGYKVATELARKGASQEVIDAVLQRHQIMEKDAEGNLVPKVVDQGEGTGTAHLQKRIRETQRDREAEQQQAQETKEKSLQRLRLKAYREIRGKGISIAGDSRVGDILQEMAKPKNGGWQINNPETNRYIQGAIEYAQEMDAYVDANPNVHPFETADPEAVASALQRREQRLANGGKDRRVEAAKAKQLRLSEELKTAGIDEANSQDPLTQEVYESVLSENLLRPKNNKLNITTEVQRRVKAATPEERSQAEARTATTGQEQAGAQTVPTEATAAAPTQNGTEQANTDAADGQQSASAESAVDPTIQARAEQVAQEIMTSKEKRAELVSARIREGKDEEAIKILEASLEAKKAQADPNKNEEEKEARWKKLVAILITVGMLAMDEATKTLESSMAPQR